jgi:5-formyltetrahydrofolate cyclo-ligase
MAARLAVIAEELGASTVGVYAATASEADPGPFVASFVASGGRVAYPRVVGPGVMTFHEAAASELAAGYHGILEPPEAAPVVATEALDLLIVPGLAFDAGGERLGRGGGFYDRVLTGVARPRLCVGLAYAAQIVSEVPRQGHDGRVDRVVTEAATLGPKP